MSSYRRFLVKALAVVAIVCVVAAGPVYALSGREGVLAFLAAAGVCLVGTAAGRAPHLFLKQGPDAIVHASLAGVGVRLLVTISLATPLLLLDVLPRYPLAAGLVIVYVVLLAFEVRELIRLGGTDAVDPSPVEPATETRPRTDPKGAPTR